MISRRDIFKGALGGAALIMMHRLGLGAMSKQELPAVDLAFLPSALDVKKRTDWTKRVPKPLILKPADGFDRITVHHSGGSVNESAKDADVIADIEGISAGHLTRGYGDIAYHFVIDRRGTIWEARSLAYEGAHVSGQNDKNIGIMLLGNYEEQTVSDKQKDALQGLLASLRKKFQIKQHRLFGHRDLGKSLCPGKNLYKYVVELKGAGEPATKKGG